MKNWKTWQKIAVAAAVPTVVLLGYVGYRTLILKKPLFPLFPKNKEWQVDESDERKSEVQTAEEPEKEQTTPKKEEKFGAGTTLEKKVDKFRGERG